MTTKIQWTEETWNPIVGCSIATPGCTNCYAMKMAWRLANNPGTPHYAETVELVKGKPIWTGKVAMAPDSVLTKPLRRRKPTTYFVNSMGDLFHEDVPDAWIDRVFAVAALCPQHILQILTKRGERMRNYCRSRFGGEYNEHISEQMFELNCASTEDEMQNVADWLDMGKPLPNVWLGVSAERQKEADERIPQLLDTPAAVRFVSVEPMLGPVDLRYLQYDSGDRLPESMRVNSERCSLNALGGITTWPTCHYQSPTIKGNTKFIDGEVFQSSGEGRALDWIICGGESGPGARVPETFETDARSLRDQCQAAGVAFFMKQMPKRTAIPADLMVRQYPKDPAHG